MPPEPRLHLIDQAFALLAAILLLLLARRLLGHNPNARPPLPPGPKGLPLIGNMLDLPKGCYWKKYRQWSDEYDSALIHLNILGSHLIVIDSCKVAEELIEKRSSIYASRPNMPMMNDLVGFDWHVGFMPYGKKWRDHRKYMHQLLETPDQLLYRPTSLHYTRCLLQHFLDAPEDWERHLRFLAAGFILSITYGLEVKSEQDPSVLRAERGMYAMGQAGHGYLVDFFPSLKRIPNWFPGAYFKREAAEWKKDVKGMVNVPFAAVQAAMRNGTARPCIASRLLSELTGDDSEEAQKREIEIKNTLGAMYAAGSDTTVSSLSSFILAMLKYPSLQRKAQAAVDQVLLGARLPDFSDYGSIPYVDALVKEVLRWNPVVPLGVPYSSMKDDIYNGCFIPKDCTIYVNAWSMLQDETTYGPDTGTFRPERFMNPEGDSLNPEVRDPTEAFGFGRRICPGMTTGRESIWMTITSILATFDIVHCVGEDGVPIEPSVEYTSAFLSHPFPFPCKFRPRSREAISMIQSATLSAT